MSTVDGAVAGGATKLVDNGPDSARWVIVILGDGYQASNLAVFATDAQAFVNLIRKTTPFDSLWPAINIYRVDVSSTDSGAKDPKACGGTGASPKTYFDATFCGGAGTVRRLLTVNNFTALNVSTTHVPHVRMTFVIVNSTIYGGSGGPVAVFSKGTDDRISAEEIALHEMGHTAFSLADEYESYAGCASGETGHDKYPSKDEHDYAEPNVTVKGDNIKWKMLITPDTPVPTTKNQDCSKCDMQANPVAVSTVGLFEGARYFHSGVYRPQYNCRMRTLGYPFCGVCAHEIWKTIEPYLPARRSNDWLRTDGGQK